MTKLKASFVAYAGLSNRVQPSNEIKIWIFNQTLVVGQLRSKGILINNEKGARSVHSDTQKEQRAEVTLLKMKKKGKLY